MEFIKLAKNPNSAKAFLNKKKQAESPKRPEVQSKVFTEKQLKEIVRGVVSNEVNKIPKAKDGKTPTKEELKQIIQPLIPVIKQPKDGEVTAKHIDEITNRVLKEVAVNPDITEAVIKIFKEENIRAEDIPGFQELKKRVEKLADNQKYLPMGGGYTDADVRRVIAADGGLGGLPDQTGNSGKFLTTDGSDASWGTPAGAGDVSKVGTPVDGQIGVWTGDGTIEGDASLTFDTTDDTLVIAASGKLGFGAVDILSDSAGTTTLQNIDALDATTEATIEAAIDTLSNLTTASSLSITESQISDLGAYITGITGEPLSDLSDVTITTIASGELLKWNGSAWINNTLAEAGIQPAPSEGAFVDGDKTKLDGIASSATANPNAIDNVVEDTTPQLGGGLDVNGNEITGAIDLHSTGDIIQELGDAAGTNKVSVRDSGAVEVAAIDSDGNITTSGTVDGRDVAADGTKLDGIEASADVTDATNVTAAGALMDSELTDIAAIKAASDASVAVTDTGTSTSAFVTPDGLAGSYAGTKAVVVHAEANATDLAVGDDLATLYIPSSVGGMNLVGVHAYVDTAGTTGTTDIQIHNETQAADMLSTKVTIDSAETSSRTAATAAVIDTANDDVAAGDKIRIDVDAVSTTAPKGLHVELEFRLP